jgi:hypothetical protein
MADERERNLKVVKDEEPISVKKPSEFNLDAFKSTHNPSIAGVETMLTALPHYKIGDANDWVHLHPDEATYWSDELCFVTVPIKGQKRDILHLITEVLAERYLPSKRIQRFRLALASKPNDVFFLCHVPSQNMNNTWNDTAYKACQKAKECWVQAASRAPEGVEGYKIEYTEDRKNGLGDPFPDPQWPKQSIYEIIYTTFAGAMITEADHPALLRLIGSKQSLA